ncbi:MAG: hypothetical protein PHI23_05185 [Candidatus Peribacteraceae bacterium]|nr:hypothetical protein [Candidatus Peribacteraceae bacterium]
MTLWKNFRRRWSQAAMAAALLFPGIAAAANLGNADEIDIGNPSGGDLKAALADIARKVLSYMTLIAMIVVIIAGIYLILSFGNDQAKDTAKKIVIYAIAGLVLIILARAIVIFIIETAGGV